MAKGFFKAKISPTLKYALDIIKPIQLERL